MVVKDDPLIRSIVEETLTDGGFQTVIVPSGENAIDLLDVQNVKYRAVLTDINLGRDRIDGRILPVAQGRSMQGFLWSI